MKNLGITFMAAAFAFSCSDSSTVSVEADPTASLSSAFDEFDKNNTDIYLDGTNVVIETNGLPNHTSPYWGEGNALYVAPEDGFKATPSLITGYDGYATLTVSVNPQKASSPSSTSLGAIGIAVSGAAIFNDQEGNGPLSSAAVSLDYSGAHIGPSEYHYHTEPHAWTKDDEKLVGIIADGFFIYGRKCNSTGTYPTDLDASGGHTSTTQHSSEPLYHYHIENDLYLNKYYIIFPGQYQGTPSNIR